MVAQAAAMERAEKIAAIAALRELRRASAAGQRRQGYSRDYRHIEAFHDGAYDRHPWVSPRTISAGNVDSDLMIVAQDWASEDYLCKPLNDDMCMLGLEPSLPFNRNLERLLREAFHRELADVFVTNAFVFAKPGGMTARIPRRDLARSAAEYGVPQVAIVRPRLVICLGAVTFDAMRRAGADLAARAELHHVPHVGALGLRATGGYDASLARWRQLVSRLDQLQAAARSFATAGTGLKVGATATAARPIENEPM
jgi:uracil-DNA glycosylase